MKSNMKSNRVVINLNLDNSDSFDYTNKYFSISVCKNEEHNVLPVIINVKNKQFETIIINMVKYLMGMYDYREILSHSHKLTISNFWDVNIKNIQNKQNLLLYVCNDYFNVNQGKELLEEIKKVIFNYILNVINKLDMLELISFNMMILSSDKIDINNTEFFIDIIREYKDNFDTKFIKKLENDFEGTFNKKLFDYLVCIYGINQFNIMYNKDALHNVNKVSIIKYKEFLNKYESGIKQWKIN